MQICDAVREGSGKRRGGEWRGGGRGGEGSGKRRGGEWRGGEGRGREWEEEGRGGEWEEEGRGGEWEEEGSGKRRGGRGGEWEEEGRGGEGRGGPDDATCATECDQLSMEAVLVHVTSLSGRGLEQDTCSHTNCKRDSVSAGVVAMMM